MPDDNNRESFVWEAKHQRDLLKDSFNHLGALAGQEDRIWDGSYPQNLLRTSQVSKGQN